jgi:hypothetical protein
VKDAVYGLPAGLKSQLIQNAQGGSAEQAMSFAKRKAFTGLVMDLGATILITSLVQDWWKRNEDASWRQQLTDGLTGYEKRAAEMWANMKDNPFSASSYNPYRLSSTWTNEPGKQDRVDMGAQPNSGRHEYMRLPTGKVIEDLHGWMTAPVETLFKKLSPVASAVKGLATNDKNGFGTPIYDPSDSFVHKAMDVAEYLVGKNIPLDQIQTGMDVYNGKGTKLDVDKLKGNFSGLTVSQGHPQGPEAAVAAKVEERVQASKKYVLEAVKRALKYGDEDKAFELLTDRASLTTREANLLIRRLQNPKTDMTPAQRKKFGQHATPEEQKQMDEVR